MIPAQLYRCPKHGRIWRVGDYDVIDCENDRVEALLVCPQCGAEVAPILEEGQPVYTEVDPEELYDYDDDDWRDDGSDDNDFWCTIGEEGKE